VIKKKERKMSQQIIDFFSIFLLHGQKYIDKFQFSCCKNSAFPVTFMSGVGTQFCLETDKVWWILFLGLHEVWLIGGLLCQASWWFDPYLSL
jgi:hypothetical protein